MTSTGPLFSAPAHDVYLALRRLCTALFAILVFGSTASSSAQNDSLALAGLRTANFRGQFNAVQSDVSGNLYLLLDEHDGLRILKTDATATNILAQAHLGATGDIGLALALDPSGNVYATGTTTSGSFIASSGAAFPNPTGSSTNTFVAKFDSALNPIFLTFAGASQISSAAIAATSTGVFITGSIFSSTLPVTPSAILQAPASGSLQNGFVEAFNPTGTALLYATYLTGQDGNTAPAAIAADATGNTYIAGYTSATGYPTLNALVPEIIPGTAGATSGFLTKLTPAGDAILFSTFIPGSGITSIALDSATSNLLLTGSIAIGDFPVANVATPLIPTNYQALLRLPLDGSSILASTLLGPGTQSFVTPAPFGSAWIASDLTQPILPVTPFSTIGSSFAAHITAQDTVDQIARFGGLPTAKPSFASAPSILTSIVSDSIGQPTIVGAITPTASSSLLSTETYDLSLFNSSTPTLPSTLHDAIPTTSACGGSVCSGSAAFLAQLSSIPSPSLALSYDAAPNLTLRNLGSVAANALSITSTSFTIATDCNSILAPGSECNIALTGSGPGTITIQSSNAPSQTITIPAFTALLFPVVFAPKELDFGIQTSTSSPIMRTITVTNLTSQPQTLISQQDTSSHSLPYTLTQSATDCPSSGSNASLLGAGATCHITLSLTASSTATNDGPINTQWTIGPSGSQRDVLITGYTQAASLSLSASTIDFGTQYTGGLRSPRYLYLSNSSDSATTHSHIDSPASSPFTIADRCPPQLEPRTVCQLQIDYIPTRTPSADSTTLALDQSLTALLTGRSLPAPGANGTSVNPNLSVTPTSITFANSVVVTTTSTTTETVTIGNTGASPFTLALSLSGDFTDTTNCNTTLGAKSTCSVILTFAPSQPGPRQGILSVTAGAGTTPIYVNINGTGVSILPANNGTLDFGGVIVNQPTVQWFKISQPFTNLSATSSNPDFGFILVEDIGYGHGQPTTTAFSSTASGTCINCWLGIQFIPSSTGPRSGTLTLTTGTSGSPYALSLTGTGLPLLGLVLAPIAQDFGTVPVRSVSAPILFTLTDLTSNSTPISVSDPTITGDFQISTTSTGGAPCTGTLYLAASCFVSIVFNPTTTGQQSGTLTLATSAGSVSAQLAGYGAPDPGLALNPIALIFQNVPGLTSTVQTITLTNTGSSALRIEAPVVTQSNFSLTNNTCASLAPSATCTISIRFTPTSFSVTGNLQIPVTATISGNKTNYTVSLAGTYTSSDTGLQIIPSQANFGPNATSTLGLTRQFTINNLTSKSLSLSVSLPRQFALTGAPCAGLSPNASCSFDVTFLPLSNGDITGTLFAQANPTDGTATLNALAYTEGYSVGSNTLAVTGPISPGNLLNFNQISSGQSSSKTLTLTNTGPANLTVRRITSQWPFLSSTTCGQTLTINQSCTVTITYTPLNQLSTGTASPLPVNDAGILAIESDALNSPNLINLAGIANPIFVSAPANTAPLISYTASQNSLTFDATAVGSASDPQTVALSNTGTVPLHILSVNSGSDFSATPRNCSTIVPGSSCDLIVFFTPQTTGTRIDALQILSDSSSSLDFISLVGAASPSTLTLAPPALSFGTVRVGSSGQLPLTVTNTSTTEATFNAVTASGDYSASLGSCPTLGNTLAPAATCTLQVTFAPTQIGIRTGALSLSTSATALPLTAALIGTGVQSQLQLSPSSLNFGNITLGSSAILTLSISNTGNAPITNLAFNTSAGDYRITAPCTRTTLAPGASCSVTVTFNPTANGARNSTITVTSSDSSSPDTILLTGAGIIGGTFTLTVNGASTATTSIVSGRPATYSLILTPVNNFSGSVALTCTPIQPADFASCSLFPSTLALNNTPQNATATIQTITSVNLSHNSLPARTNSLGGAILCLLTPALWIFWRRPQSIRTILWTTLLTAAALSTLLAANGCGGGGDPAIRYSPPGNYQYQVTASSTSGPQVTQTVTLNLTVTPR